MLFRSYDNIVLDDAGYQENIYSTLTLLPEANGSTMSWTSGTGLSDYTQVYDIPPGDTTYVASAGGTANQIAYFALSNRPSNISTNNVILAVKLIVRVRETTGTPTTAFVTRLVSGATTYSTAPKDMSGVVQPSGILLTTDPNTGAAWTWAAIDALQVGGIETTTKIGRAHV